AWCWTPVDEWVNYHQLPDWDSSAMYKKGDICRLDMCEWVATADNKGVKPYVRLGYVDSMERIEEWIDNRFQLIDSYFEYTVDVGFKEFATDTSDRSNDIETIYDLQGRRVLTPQRGGLYIRGGKKFIY
ncbi:MAG: hypothetical protein IKX24_06125, partial [Prevotella sp.]|nr:hypothetical protein [Prevotella sp.]